MALFSIWKTCWEHCYYHSVRGHESEYPLCTMASGFFYYYYWFLEIQLNKCNLFFFFYYLSIKYFSLDFLKYTSRSFSKPYFLYCWLVLIIFILSAFIYTETFPWVLLQISSGPYPNRTYGFASPTCLWKVVARLPVFVIEPVAINTLICFNAVPQVGLFWWIVVNLFIKITEDCYFCCFSRFNNILKYW